MKLRYRILWWLTDHAEPIGFGVVVAAILVLAAVLSGCGGAPPSRAELVHVRDAARLVCAEVDRVLTAATAEPQPGAER